MGSWYGTYGCNCGSPPYPQFPFTQFQLPMVTGCPEADGPSDESSEGQYSSLTLHRDVHIIHLTSSHHVGILSSHITARGVSTV